MAKKCAACEKAKMQKMAKGGSLKPVDASKNPGLSKLPTPVRNKMGYQKTGGENPKLTKAKQDSIKGAQNIDVLISDTKGMNTTAYKTAIKKAQDLMKKPAQVRKELGIKKMGGTIKKKK